MSTVYHPLNEQAILQQAHDHGELLHRSYTTGAHLRWWRRHRRAA